MADRPRRRLSTGAIVGISLGACGLAIIGGFVVLIVAAVTSYFTPVQSSRFERSEAAPACIITGDFVTVYYPIGHADVAYDPNADYRRDLIRNLG